MLNRSSTRIQLIVFGVLLAVLLTCSIIYGLRSNSFAPISQATSSTNITFTNSEILRNWLPVNSYAYTVARMNDYLRTNDITATSMTVTSDVTFNMPTYNFTVKLAPQSQTLSVVVTVTNDSAVLSTTVSINGQEQDPVVPTAQHSTLGPTSYTGFDALINTGLTAIQSNELEQALQVFAPSASSIAIDSTSIQLGSIASDDMTQPYTFVLSIDGTSYNATLDAIGLLSIRLYLNDSSTSNHQVFDSGMISQGS